MKHYSHKVRLMVANWDIYLFFMQVFAYCHEKLLVFQFYFFLTFSFSRQTDSFSRSFIKRMTKNRNQYFITFLYFSNLRVKILKILKILPD